MNKSELKAALEQQRPRITSLYGQEQEERQIARYGQLIDDYERAFGNMDCALFSAPGRTEVGGNHTDHQHGRVLAASVNMDAAAAAGRREGEVVFYSEGFEIKPVSLADLFVHPEEKNTSEALIRGVLAGFVQRGYKIGGFQAVSNSTVLKGSGISSSAAFEVLVGTILSHLYNDGQVSAQEIAKIGQYAENVYFGKPSGLLDQMACSVGNFVTIDFKDPQNVLVEQVDFDFNHSQIALCLVDTRQDHADLSDEYGLMPAEMRQVAAYFGAEVLRQVDPAEFYRRLREVRSQVQNDRAILRAIHFFEEDARVPLQVQALKDQDLKRFFELVIESGHSSFMYLQNVTSPSDIRHQSLALALALSENVLKGHGAWRVHGGGLAGTIQAFVPLALLETYQKVMDDCFGAGSCHVLSIRPEGGVRLI